MIKIENVEVFGWDAAIRGMRNPKNSWDQCDSLWDFVEDTSHINPCDDVKFVFGPNDLKLASSLANAGDDHGKFLRMISVTFDITAPLYFLKEFDTFKVGTVSNSCSTMNKIHAKEFTLDDFSWEQLLNTGCDLFEKEWDNGLFRQSVQPLQLMTDFIIPSLNVCREKFLETEDKAFWWQMIQLLPSSYNQRRTIQLNYQVLRHMYKSRKNHKLDEWRDFCRWVETLPYFDELIKN